MPARQNILTRIELLYERFAGPDASLGALPLAVMRSLCGDRLLVRAHGRPFLVDLRDTFVSFKILTPLGYERGQTAALKNLIRPGDRVIDLGAHIGYFTVLVNELAGPEGRVLAVEPDPENAELLRRNAAHALWPSTIQVVEGAAGAAHRRALLYRAPGNRGDHRMFDARAEVTPKGAARVQVEVAMLTVDDCTAQWDRVDLVKMDVQGYETEVLRGMQKTLSRNPNLVLVTEYSPYLLRYAGVDPPALLGMLTAQGFSAWEIGRRGSLAPVDVETVTASLTGKDELNLVCARGRAIEERVRPLLDAAARVRA
jgi:FkbM family methyltransferase